MLKKNVLVTGGAGFIGSHLCEFLISKNYNVFCIDNFITGEKKNISHLQQISSFKLHEFDITKEFEINTKIDSIYHLASPASPKFFINNPVKTLITNALGSLNVINFAIKNNSTLLVASTSEIYGNPKEHPQNETYFGNVNVIGPRSSYDEGKRFMESLTYAHSKKLKIRIARIFNTYGPRMKKDDGRVIPNFINQSLDNNNHTVYGNGLQTRSFCYVDDTVRGIYKLMNTDYCNPINIGNNHEITILELSKKIQKLLKIKKSIDFLPLPEDDPSKRKPNINLAKKIIDWSPEIDLEIGLLKTINYFRGIKNNG